MDYMTIKLIHIISSTLLFGTGLGTAFFMVRANATKDLNTIRNTTSTVVLADWLFTTPSVIIQPVTGFYLMHMAQFSFESLWFYLVVGLYLIAGCCWVPVVFIQTRLNKLSARANSWDEISQQYTKLYNTWFTLGFPAFISVLILFYLMVFKPFLTVTV